MAKKLGLAGAGNHSLSWDDKQGYVFTNRSSGEQFQVGTFGNSGKNVQRLNIDKDRYDHLKEIKDGSYGEYHHGEQRHFYGTSSDFGNDTLSMFIDGNPTVLAQNYSQFFRGTSPHTGGRAFVDHIAKQVGGYGKIAQGIRDAFTASAEQGINFNSTLWGKVAENILGIQLKGGMQEQRAAIESIDTNTVAVGMQNKYGDIVSQNKSTQWKMDQFTTFTNDIFNVINKNATMNTAQQMMSGVDNPAKGQGVPDRSNRPSHYTGR